MYIVKRQFQDKDGRVYKVDDIYPHEGTKKPSTARIKLLSSTNNKYGQIYIEKLEV